MLKFALAGNPNCGKTTLFNCLTGSTAHVGNWPGVTVDKKEGIYKKGSEPVAILDLPGIYSLSPYSPEEVIARDYILDQKPDLVINIVDATNLERNLYLTTQLLEIEVPVVVALNMMDAVEKSGNKVSAKVLEDELAIPVVEISALKEKGIKELMDRAIAAAKRNREAVSVLGGSKLADAIGEVKTLLYKNDVKDPLFHAIKLVEGDELEVKAHPDAYKLVTEYKERISDDVFGDDFEAIVADERYKYISKHFSKAFVRKDGEKVQLTKSDKADRVLTHRIWGIPIFVVILFAIFHLTFAEDFLYLGAMGALGNDWVSLAGKWGEGMFGSSEGIASPGVILFNLLDSITGSISDAVAAGMEGTTSAWAQGLVVDGIFGGLFSVLSFLPQILVLFMFFSILEDSGYMARVAFILDRMFRKFGLSGRAFMPMIMGFGCSVPAMINTRTLADDNERTATIRVIPFFSCGAKLPILVAVSGAIAQLFSSNADAITFGMYILYPGHSGGNPFGAVHAQHHHARRHSSLHHGAPRLPRPAGKGSRPSPLGQDQTLHQEGVHHHPAFHNPHLVPAKVLVGLALPRRGRPQRQHPRRHRQAYSTAVHAPRLRLAARRVRLGVRGRGDNGTHRQGECHRGLCNHGNGDSRGDGRQLRRRG